MTTKQKIETTPSWPTTAAEIQPRPPAPGEPLPAHIQRTGVTRSQARALIAQMFYHRASEWTDPGGRLKNFAKQTRWRLGTQLLLSFCPREMREPYRLNQEPVGQVEPSIVDAITTGYRPLPPTGELVTPEQAELVREGFERFAGLVRQAKILPYSEWVTTYIETVHDELSRPCYWHDNVVQMCIDVLGFCREADRFEAACLEVIEREHSEAVRREAAKQRAAEAAEADERLAEERAQWGITA